MSGSGRRGSPDDKLDPSLHHEANWEIVRLSEGDYDCSRVNPETGKSEQIRIPKGFNPHNIRGISFNSTKETCKVEWAENASLPLPTSLFRALKAEIQAPKRKRIPIEDLEAILRRKQYSGPVRREMKKAWAELLAGKETVLQIALGSGISKQSVYKYRDLWLDYNIVLLNGPQLRPHPDLFELTVTET